jgi:hypothetical protein
MVLVMPWIMLAGWHQSGTSASLLSTFLRQQWQSQCLMPH